MIQGYSSDSDWVEGNAPVAEEPKVILVFGRGLCHVRQLDRWLSRYGSNWKCEADIILIGCCIRMPRLRISTFSKDPLAFSLTLSDTLPNFPVLVVPSSIPHNPIIKYVPN